MSTISNDPINLGDEVHDVVTGFTGIAVSRLDFLSGCRQYAVQGRVKDNVISEAQWFDYQRLKPTGTAVVLSTRDSGGPAPGQRLPAKYNG